VVSARQMTNKLVLLGLLCVVLPHSLFVSASCSSSMRTYGKESPVKYSTSYRTVQIEGLSIFYREAGSKEAPTLLPLHGFPSSSRMYEPLLARLSDRYHLVAPDYPGFGHSDWPEPGKFAYTFDHIAEIMNHFTEALGLSRYTLYLQDYGGPVGFRVALAIRTASMLSSSKMLWRIIQAWGRIGRRGGLSGPIALHTKARCA